jgi:hypothetical protein
MDRNAILNAMEKKASTIYSENPDYAENGKRGVMVVQTRDAKNKSQWDATQRSYGAVFRDYAYEDDLVVNNGQNFDALVHGKVAFTRRTGLDSGTNYYQVLGYESYWKGSVISEDGECICAYAGFTALDDQLIARAGIACYESLKRTGKSLAKGKDEEEENGEDEDAGEDEE